MRHVGGREEEFEVGVDGAVAHIECLVAQNLRFFRLLCFESIGEFLCFQFQHRLFQNLLIGFVAQVGNKAALFGAQQIAGAANVEVLHSDLNAGAEVGKTLNGIEAAHRHGREGSFGRNREVAKRLAIAAPHPPAELVQVAQSIVLSIVDDNGVHIGHIHTAFNDGGGKEHIVVVIRESNDAFFQFFGVHLSVSHHHPCIRHQAVNHIFENRQLIDAAVHEKHLSVARQLKIDGLFHDVVVERFHRGEDRVAVGRRGVDSA